jgi:prevent-host-death family protein
MIKVQIAQLKNGLSLYLRKVRQGVEILITDRDEPIARIVPLSATEQRTATEVLHKLQAENLLDVNFSAKTREKRLRRVRLASGPSTTELIRQDRDR